MAKEHSETQPIPSFAPSTFTPNYVQRIETSSRLAFTRTFH